jgi:hypothetical protein
LPPLKVAANFDGTMPAPGNMNIELSPSRRLLPTEGSLAVMIAKMDVTGMLVQTETGWRYTPSLVPLPGGASEVVVYLVSPKDEWVEIARLPLLVAEPPTPASVAAQPQSATPAQTASKPATRKFGLKPSITVGMKSQPAASDFGSPLPRREFADATMQGSLQNSIAGGGLTLQNRFEVVGTSFLNEALRFPQQGIAAPKVDLSSFTMVLQFRKAKLQAGQLILGGNRQLVNSFATRGVMIQIPLAPWLDFSAAAANGSNIVGWSNIFGLNNRKHQVVTGTVGIDFLPKRPGGARLEVTALDGSTLPIRGFNQGVVNDSEKSRGISGRLLMSGKSQRFRFDGGYTRSKFTNPFDSQVAGTNNIVAVKETMQDAEYADASFAALRNISFGKTQKLNLTLNYRHERADPLYRSVASSTQADRLQNQFEVSGNLGPANLLVSHTRFNNNLGNLNSILTTLNRQNAVNFTVPFGAIFGHWGQSPSPWLPLFAYSDTRVHSFGQSMPALGFISASQIPNQFSTVQTASFDWQKQRARWGYRFNRSFQDNRQPGRELADLRNLVNAFTLGVNARSNLDLGWELNFEDARNFELSRTDRLWRSGMNANWRMTPAMVFTMAVTGTLAGDSAQTKKTRNAEVDAQWSYHLGHSWSDWKRIQTQVSIHYANRYGRIIDNLARFSNLTRVQTLNVNLSVSFF